MGSTSSPSMAESQWKSIWLLGIMGSIRHFVWRACHEILSIRVNLLARRIANTNRCSICTQEAKTVIHVLWRFLTASNIWGDVVSPIKKWPTNYEDFWSLWSCMITEFPPRQLALSAMILRNH